MQSDKHQPQGKTPPKPAAAKPAMTAQRPGGSAPKHTPASGHASKPGK